MSNPMTQQIRIKSLNESFMGFKWESYHFRENNTEKYFLVKNETNIVDMYYVRNSDGVLIFVPVIGTLPYLESWRPSDAAFLHRLTFYKLPEVNKYSVLTENNQTFIINQNHRTRILPETEIAKMSKGTLKAYRKSIKHVLYGAKLFKAVQAIKLVENTLNIINKYWSQSCTHK